MKILFLSVLLVIAANGSAQADTLFRWTDKEGKVHYGDRPAEDAKKVETKRFGAEPEASDDELPYSTRKAKQDFPVTLYVAANCVEFCIKARDFLNKRGVPFTEKSILTKEDLAAFTKIGGSNIPALTVGKNLLSGFEAGQWNSGLDTAGYPKTAPYGIRTTQPAKATSETKPDTKPVTEGATEKPADTPTEVSQ